MFPLVAAYEGIKTIAIYKLTLFHIVFVFVVMFLVSSNIINHILHPSVDRIYNVVDSVNWWA